MTYSGEFDVNLSMNMETWHPTILMTCAKPRTQPWMNQNFLWPTCRLSDQDLGIHDTSWRFGKDVDMVISGHP